MDEHTPERKCPDCQRYECSKAELADYDDAEGHADWADAAWSCAEAQVKLLREAIAALPEAKHVNPWNRNCGETCYCGADEINAAREHARRVAGLEG